MSQRYSRRERNSHKKNVEKSAGKLRKKVPKEKGRNVQPCRLWTRKEGTLPRGSSTEAGDRRGSKEGRENVYKAGFPSARVNSCM